MVDVPCQVGRCDLQSAKCEAETVPGNCFIDGRCYGGSEALAGNMCRRCDPVASQTAFTDMACPGGQICAPASGACVIATCPDRTSPGCAVTGFDIVDGHLYGRDSVQAGTVTLEATLGPGPAGPPAPPNAGYRADFGLFPILE